MLAGPTPQEVLPCAPVVSCKGSFLDRATSLASKPITWRYRWPLVIRAMGIAGGRALMTRHCHDQGEIVEAEVTHDRFGDPAHQERRAVEPQPKDMTTKPCNPLWGNLLRSCLVPPPVVYSLHIGVDYRQHHGVRGTR